MKGRVNNRNTPATMFDKIVWVANPTTKPPKDPTVSAAAGLTLNMDATIDNKTAIPDILNMLRIAADVG
jgi:hypothetical protein